jgi:regulator of replication initiation timing
MNDQIQKLQDEIDNLKKQLDALSNNATIPLEVGNAMRARLLSDGTLTGSTSGNGPSVHSVNESGNSTYNVASPMIGFINIVINGTSYAVPYY